MNSRVGRGSSFAAVAHVARELLKGTVSGESSTSRTPRRPHLPRTHRGVQVVQKLYTTETLAELLQVSPRTIRRERKEGRLPFVRVRGQIRYRESDVRAYLERNASLSADGSSLGGQVNWAER